LPEDKNDIQGDGNLTEGNWISGIKALDEFRLGPQDGLPVPWNKTGVEISYTFLPLILGHSKD